MESSNSRKFGNTATLCSRLVRVPRAGCWHTYVGSNPASRPRVSSTTLRTEVSLIAIIRKPILLYELEEQGQVVGQSNIRRFSPRDKDGSGSGRGKTDCKRLRREEQGSSLRCK